MAVATACVIFSPAAAAAEGGKIVCWTDEHGKRACGDHVPPQYANKERKVYDQRGIVVETQERQKTPEEIAAEKRQEQQRAEEEKQRKEQAAYDRYLLQTFNAVSDLEKARDERLAMIDGRIGLAEKAVTNDEAALQSLREHEKPDAETREKIAQFEKSLAQNRDALAQLKANRQKVADKFAEDIARFRLLRGETPAATSGN